MQTRIRIILSENFEQAAVGASRRRPRAVAVGGSLACSGGVAPAFDSASGKLLEHS